MPWKLRPFEDYTDRGEGRAAWVITGAIVGNRFVLSVHGQTVQLKTEQTGTDQRGPFAIVHEGSFELPDGFQVQLYQEDEDADALALHVFRSVESEAKGAALARELGFDPERVNFLVPPEQQRWIYFDLDGRPERWQSARGCEGGGAKN